jgi:hypothetical protein
MNCELAKQLKDARFPLKAASQADSNARRPMFQYGKDSSIGRDNTWWLEPTLDELMHACLAEKPLETIEFTVRNDYASVSLSGFSDEDGTPHTFEGSNASEAVARLFLALHATTNGSTA